MSEANQFVSKDFHQGFTLLEVLVVVMVIGIMAGLMTPSMLGFVYRGRVNQGLSELKGIVQTTQREAIKKSQSCTVDLPLNETENPIITGTCLITGSVVLENVKIKYNNANSNKINFNFRGETSPLRTIVIYSDQTKHKKCMVISNGIGMIRVGDYTSNDLLSISADNCQTTI